MKDSTKKLLRPYNEIYDRLVQFLPDNWQNMTWEAYHLKSQGYMDLCIEPLGPDTNHDNRIIISLTHYYEQNGDLMADPDMTISLSTDPEWPVAEALTYLQDGLGINQSVYKLADGQMLVSPKLKKQLNRFLLFWLKNLKVQGFNYN